MIPDTRDGHPFPNKISAPRLVCQQFDAINFNTMLAPWRSSVLSKLWTLMHTNKDPKVFYTIYLAVFIILHEVSATSKDRYWHARMKNVDLRYDMELFMEELQEGANILLCAWSHYRRGFNPLDADWVKIRDPNKKRKNQYMCIKPDEERLMRALAEVSGMDTGSFSATYLGSFGC
jgi:hypothetical protein